VAIILGHFYSWKLNGGGGPITRAIVHLIVNPAARKSKLLEMSVSRSTEQRCSIYAA
jgi:hypothetical protein